MRLIKTNIVGWIVVLFAANALHAQNLEQIYLKSGSVVDGYISQQVPGKYIVVQSETATIVVSSDSLRKLVTKDVEVSKLPKEWKEWAKANNKLVVNNKGESVLPLSKVELSGNSYSNVYIMERGSHIKFIDLSPNQYHFKWGDLYRTLKHPHPQNLYSGLKEILVLDDGTSIEGQIIEQYPGNYLKMVVSNGDIHSYDYNRIRQIKTIRYCDQIELWPQIQLLDKVEVYGETIPYVGLISVRELGKYIVMLFDDGRSQTIPLDKVVSYAKIPNKSYRAIYDKELKEGDILLNGENAYFSELKSYKSFLLLGDTVSVVTKIGSEICIEARLKDVNTQVSLVKAHNEKVAITDKKNVQYVEYPVVSYQDFVQCSLPLRRELTPLGNIRILFNVNEVGDYVLHFQGVSGYVVINVTE